MMMGKELSTFTMEWPLLAQSVAASAYPTPEHR